MLSDEELVRQYRSQPEGSGREKLINDLFQRHYRRVGAWCYRWTGDRESAADLAQEIFIRAYRSLDSFRGDAKFTTWLYTVARNHCTNQMKAQAAQADYRGDELDPNLADSQQPDVLELLQRQESVEFVRDVMNHQLDETENRVMVLHYGEEMPLDSITRLLGLTNASGAKAYIVSARRKLSAAVQRWAGR